MIELIAAEKEEETLPRLFSRGFKARAATDEVAPQHLVIHSRLVRWGAWARSRTTRRSLASVEGLYSKDGTPPATAPLSADIAIIDIERCVIRMPMQHGETLRLLYVRRFAPTTICRDLRLRYEDFPRWVFDCRAMCQNLLRRYGR